MTSLPPPAFLIAFSGDPVRHTSAALKEECCFYSCKTGLVQDTINKVKISLEERNRNREKQEYWYKNWFSTAPWLSTLLPTLLGPFMGILLLLSFVP